MPAEQARAELARYLPQEEVDRGVETLRGAALMYDEARPLSPQSPVRLHAPRARWRLMQVFRCRRSGRRRTLWTR